MDSSSHSKVIIEISTLADIPFEFVGKVASSSAGSEALLQIRLAYVWIFFMSSCTVLRDWARDVSRAAEGQNRGGPWKVGR